MRPFAAKLLASLTAVAALAFTAAAPAKAEPAIWVVKGPHSTVYLFGTIHLLRPDAAWLTPKIQKAFESSDRLTLEIVDVDDPAAMAPLVQKYGVDTEHPLSSILSPADDARFEALEAGFGMPPKALDKFRPWLAGLTLTVQPLVKAGYDPTAGVDRDLKARAVALKKPVDAMETSEQQLLYFANMPQPEAISFLRESMDESDDTVAKIDKLEKAWAAGDVKEVAAELDDDVRKEDPKLYQLLLVDRNKGFADKIEQRLQGTGTDFVAIGAAHLAGPDSVQHMLEAKGYKVERF
jgi:hypothetical protein